jgi:hypothetical protein
MYPNWILQKYFFPNLNIEVGYHIFKFFYSTKTSIYQIYVVIYQLDIDSKYQLLGFRIFCKKMPLRFKNGKKVNIKVKKNKMNN